MATATRLDIKLQLGAVAEQITVRAAKISTINTVDATVGNPFGEELVKSLPFSARNPMNLLTLQPGVVFTGESDTDLLFQGSIQQLDHREGAVNGIRGNQSNITVDGVDANDWENQAAFTSALPLTLDSIQEFRVTTSNANATEGGAAGAQVALVTKSGSNQWHGNLRWYHRNTATAANSFFNNAAGLPTLKLIRNIAGTSVGGPIRREQAFFFFDFETRRESSEEPVFRSVPTETLKAGFLTYETTAGTIATLAPADIQALDPAGLGVNPAMLQFMSLYPGGNDPSQGRDAGLNFSGFRFNAPLKTNNNIYTLRLDFNLSRDGRHTAFWRGTLGDIKRDLLPAQFPDRPPASTLLNNSKGFVSSYTAQLRPTLINTFRWGLTRLGVETSGRDGDRFGVTGLGFDNHTNFNRAEERRVPTHEFKDDLTWIRGRHVFQTGVALRYIRDDGLTKQLSFPTLNVNPGFCFDFCRDPVDALNADGDLSNDPADPFTFAQAFMMLTGPITQVIATAFFDPEALAVLPQGTPKTRKLAENDFEMYVQDSWRLRPNLTLTLGLRYSYFSPVWEQKGRQVRPTIDLGDWWEQRVSDMFSGIPSDRSPLLAFDLAGKANDAPSWWEPDKNNLAPRVALAWSPGFTDGVGEFLFGGPGRSSVRAGFGVFYGRVGGSLSVATDTLGSTGLTNTLISPFQFGLANAPRFSGTCDVSGCTGLPPLNLFLNLPSTVAFPFVPSAFTENVGLVVDNDLSTPYSMNFALSVQRELTKSITLDIGYVGTSGRQLPTKTDFGQFYGFFVDTNSGQDFWGAYSRIVDLIGPDVFNPATPVGAVAPVAFFENTLPNLPGYLASLFGDPSFSGLTSTQAFYVLASSLAPSWADPAFFMDALPAFLGDSPWSAALDPERDGRVLFQQQFFALPAWVNWGSSNYHSLQVSVRKTAGDSVFGFNYVLSKSIDNGSRAVSVDVLDITTLGFGSTFLPDIPNAFLPKAHRAVSDFDLRHNFNAHWVIALPFGRGRTIASSASGVLQALVGGWQVVGNWRWRSGFPLSPGNGFNFPTAFINPPPATLLGPLSTDVTRSDPNGLPNLFQVPDTARALLAFTRPGGVGSRNVLRSPAYFSVDLGLDKRFDLPWGENHRLVFRWEAFNLFNNVNFGTVFRGQLEGSIDLDVDSQATFGRIIATAGPRGGAREMQFALRYEF